mgnify:CR=1 FL=1
MNEIIKNFTADWIEVIIAAAALIVSILSLKVSILSLKKVAKANKLSSEANNISSEANNISVKANKIAEQALEKTDKELDILIKDKMSSFKVKLISINFHNDAYNCEDMKDALLSGTAECEFEIENTSDKYATSVTFEKFDGAGLDIDSHQNKDLNHFISLYKVNYNKPELKLKEKRVYSINEKMYWSNGALNFSCAVTFSFLIQKDNSSKGRNWELCIVEEGICKTSTYMSEMPE